uniref:DUF218 domain-containing protein n=1 Tax=Magnetococcus massalia (strain MO-1) TaxID=451514 RepID=A0A1S7LNG8_MAGMO|nr:Conserved protein of unknown function [Candidatus Magnetococcus massalia]
MTAPLFNHLLQVLVLPPGNLLIPLAFALWAIGRHPRWAKGAIWLTIGLLYIQSIPWSNHMLVSYLETLYPALSRSQIAASPAQAIVILGHGRYPQAPEYGGKDTTAAGALVRMRYGATLQRQTKLPIMVTGGAVFSGRSSEASLMAEVLERELHVPVKWQESSSRNTWENAKNAVETFKKEGIDHIFVVTHAKHMRRAIWSFEQQGIQVTAAPTMFKTIMPPFPLAYLPGAIGEIRTALHEYLGLIYYRLVSG